MKHLFLLLISWLIALNAFAGGIQYFEHVKSLYAQERYTEALQGFKICLNLYSDELDVEDLNNWISKCNERITQKQKETQERIKNQTFAAERKAVYNRKQREREEKKLILVSTNAMALDADYPAMQSAIKGFLSDAGFKFTDNQELACWSVYVTAKAYECAYSEDEQVYYSSVNACVKIENNISGEIVYENEISDVIGYNIHSYAKAVPSAYKKLNKELGEIIVKNINKQAL